MQFVPLLAVFRVRVAGVIDGRFAVEAGDIESVMNGIARLADSRLDLELVIQFERPSDGELDAPPVSGFEPEFRDPWVCF